MKLSEARSKFSKPRPVPVATPPVAPPPVESERENRFRPTPPAQLGSARSPFYQMNVAFTGKLETMTRNVARERIEERGGFVMSSVSSSTDFLVIGRNRRIGATSSKERKARALVKDGHRIKILGESDFLEMIYGRV